MGAARLPSPNAGSRSGRNPASTSEGLLTPLFLGLRLQRRVHLPGSPPGTCAGPPLPRPAPSACGEPSPPAPAAHHHDDRWRLTRVPFAAWKRQRTLVAFRHGGVACLSTFNTLILEQFSPPLYPHSRNIPAKTDMQEPTKMKLYRYRPLTEVLFKELLYREIYFASPKELNDPLDLNGQLNFFTDRAEKARALARFLCKRMFVLHSSANEYTPTLTKRSIDLLRHQDDLERFISEEFAKGDRTVVAKSDLYEILSRFFHNNALIDKGMAEFLVTNLFSDLNKSFSLFLSNSSAVCFSKSCTNFLMWSHYASGHAGICLEFEVDVEPRNSSVCGFSLVSSLRYDGKRIGWKEDVKAVQYLDSLGKIDFYDLLPIFGNEGDVDLMNLSKSYWHSYAERIEQLFLQKLEPWHEEEEWRIVHVSFQEKMPERRLLNFDDKALTGIFFGAKASQT